MDFAAELGSYIAREFLQERGPHAVGRADDLTRLLDSVHIMLLARHLEQTYGIEVADEEISLDNFESIEKLAAFVQRKRA